MVFTTHFGHTLMNYNQPTFWGIACKTVVGWRSSGDGALCEFECREKNDDQD